MEAVVDMVVAMVVDMEAATVVTVVVGVAAEVPPALKEVVAVTEAGMVTGTEVQADWATVTEVAAADTILAADMAARTDLRGSPLHAWEAKTAVARQIRR